MARIKSIFCSYRGILIVHDTLGNRVNELCGEMTIEKCKEVDSQITDETRFDGREHYDCILAKLEKEKEEKERAYGGASTITNSYALYIKAATDK